MHRDRRSVYYIPFLTIMFAIQCTQGAYAAPVRVNCPNDPPRFQGYYGRCAQVNSRGFVGFVAQCLCDGTCAAPTDPRCTLQETPVSTVATSPASQRVKYGRVFGMFGRPGNVPVNKDGQYDPKSKKVNSDRFNYGACRRGRAYGMDPKRKRPQGGICIDAPSRTTTRPTLDRESLTYVPFPSVP